MSAEIEALRQRILEADAAVMDAIRYEAIAA